MKSPLGQVHLIADLDVLGQIPHAEARVRNLLEAGLPSLSLRGRGRTAAQLAAEGRELRAAAREHGALFLVNGPREAAGLLDANGIHLPATARPLPPDERRPWGRSAHDARELEAAAASGARWVFLSPVFPTASKPGALGLGLETFAALARNARVPVLALGGITGDNAKDCLAAGAAGVAAIRGLLGDDGPEWVRGATRRGALPLP